MGKGLGFEVGFSGFGVQGYRVESLGTTLISRDLGRSMVVPVRFCTFSVE